MLTFLSAVCLTVGWVTTAATVGEPVTITGQVVNADDSPAQHATVTLYDPKLTADQHRTTVSGEDGRFRFTDVPSSDLERLGLRATSQDGNATAMISRGQVAHDGEISGARLKLDAVWRFRLSVTDETGKPVESATALVKLAEFDFFEAQTNAAGQAEYALPAAAKIAAVAAWKGQVGFGFRTYGAMQRKGQPSVNLPLHFPDDTEESLTLREARKVVVKVIDAEGMPIGNAKVSPAIFDSRDDSGLFTPPRAVSGNITAANGLVQFDWIPVAAKSLYFSVESKPDYLDAFQPFSLEDPEVVITLERPVIIRGEVKDADGQPKAGLQVVVAGTTYDDSFNAQTTTDAEGHYELSVKPNGVYIVAVVDQQRIEKVKDGIVIPRESAWLSLDFQLSKATRLSGRMLDVSTRNPVAGEKLRLVRQARQLNAEEIDLLKKPAKPQHKSLRPMISIETITDANGEFEFWAEQGDYSVKYMNQSVDQRLAQSAVTLTLPAKVPVLSTFTGTVVDAQTGQPLAGMSVYELNYGSDWQVTTDTEGKFTVKRSLDGAFLMAFSRGYAVAGVVDAPPGATEVRIECLPTGSVHGKLVSADGQPLAKRKLDYQLPLRSETSSQVAVLGTSVVTDDQGEFTIKPILAGHEYYLGTPGTAGRMNQLKKFQVEPGQSLNLGSIQE